MTFGVPGIEMASHVTRLSGATMLKGAFETKHIFQRLLRFFVEQKVDNFNDVQSSHLKNLNFIRIKNHFNLLYTEIDLINIG